MTVLWTSESATHATGGRTTKTWEATGVSIDTRTIAAGDLFVALKDIRDGHDFVKAAFTKGAAAALVSRVPEGLDETAPLLIVDDVLEALAGLGRAGRERTRARVIAITGSAGKTSTKDMMRDMLAGQGRVHAAEASYNNHWGVPLTLARMPADTDYAVIEIGMNAPGEIAPLARLARPHVAVVTTVAPAHLAAFEDISGIAHEKASIFEGVEPGGTAIYNADVETTPILATAASKCAKALSFGESEGADMRIDTVETSQEATVVRAHSSDETLLFKIGAPGRHFAMNALAALTAIRVAGADPALAAMNLGRWAPPAGRGTRETINLDAVDEHLTIDLIDDAFNANPASLKASLDVLAAATPKDGVGRVATGRRIAILGDMLELGPDAPTLHRAIADLPAIKNVARIHCVGPLMAELWDALPEQRRGEKAATAEDLARRAHTLVDAGDIVLVKGSKGSRISLVVEALRKLGQMAS
ncbi:MAG: UDP-N-acetylmuramoyl-tripeptide--D-alanyl-D-alanine ligase [Pseudomonadota bacterium]